MIVVIIKMIKIPIEKLLAAKIIDLELNNGKYLKLHFYNDFNISIS